MSGVKTDVKANSSRIARLLRIASVAAYGTAGCGGNTDSPDLAAPTAFERSVLELCGLEPSDDPLHQRLRSSLVAGQATFHPEEAERCVSWLRENGCLHVDGPGLSFFELRLPGICRHAYSGNVAVGDACTSSEACLGDSYCRAHGESLSTCESRSAAGAECQSIDQCSVLEAEIPNCLPDDAGVSRCSPER
jgi:hypothetical protein